MHCENRIANWVDEGALGAHLLTIVRKRLTINRVLFQSKRPCFDP